MPSVSNNSRSRNAAAAAESQLVKRHHALESWEARARRVIEAFVPGEWSADPERTRRARLMVRFGFVGFAFGMLYAAFYVVIGHFWGAAVIVVCSVGFGAVPWIMRSTRRLELAGNALAAILTIGFTALCGVEGGLRGHAAAWLASVPLCALLLVGKDSARFWVVICFLIGSALVAAEIKGIALPMTYDPVWHSLLTSAGFLGLIAFMFLLGLIFESGRERAFGKMRDALDELASSNAKLVVLNQEKTEFLGIAAHDLKNPLSRVITYAQLLKMSKDSADTAKMSGEIQSAGKQMLGLIVNLLDSNAIEEGRFPFKIERCELNPLVAQSVEHNQLSATRKGIVISFAPAAELTARADPNTTVQILDNLLSNAIKYSLPDTTVVVQTSRDRNQVLVAVTDQGPGISPDDQSKLFGKFTRLTARPTAGESSSGLGLSIVKKLTEAMSGAVECRSVLGSGATFTVRLPAWDVDSSAAAFPASGAGTRSS